MALAFVAASNAGHVNNGLTSRTGTEPTGTAQNNLLIALYVVGSGSGSAPGAPSGWTTLYSGLTAAGGASHFYYNIAYVVRGATAPSLSWTKGATSAYDELTILCFSGNDTTTPIDSSANGTPVNAANPDPPSTTAVSSAAMAVCFGTQWNGSASSWTPPSGYTLVSRNNAGDDSSVAYKALTASGAEDPSAFAGGSGTNDAWAATVTLAPAGVGGTGATVTAVPAAGIGDIPAPVVTAGSTVAAVPMVGVGDIPMAAGAFSSEIVAVPAAGVGGIVDPAVSGTGSATVVALPMAGVGDVIAPALSAASILTVVPMAGVGDIPAPSLVAGSAVVAPTLAGIGDLVAPGVSSGGAVKERIAWRTSRDATITDAGARTATITSAGARTATFQTTGDRG